MNLGPCHTCGGTGIVDYSHRGARPTDPATSHAASDRHAGDVRRFGPDSRQGRILKWYHYYDAPATAQEAARALWPTAPISTLEGARRRVSDLVRAGLLEASGTLRRNEGSSDEAIAWWITDAGRTAAEALLRGEVVS
jgi:hypothetical protein